MTRKGSKGRSIKNLPYTKRVWKTRKDGVRQRYWIGKKPKHHSKNIGRSYFNVRYRDNLMKKKKNYDRTKLIVQKFVETLLYQTPVGREITLSYKIALNVCSIWNDFNTISQKEGKVNFVEDTARAGLSIYQIKMMYDLIDNRIPMNERLDTKKILENVFLDLTKEEILLVFNSI